MRSNKGFTLTELIVVIAIIAILAAVLIPGVTVYLNKAKISSDHQTIDGMNEVISLKKAESGEIKNIGEIYEALEEAGFNFRAYKPLTKEYRVIYDRERNQVLFIDDNGTSIYPSKDESISISDNIGNWYNQDGTMIPNTNLALRTFQATEVNSYQFYEVKTAADLYGVSYLVNEGLTNGSAMNFFINSDIDMSFGEWIPIGNSANPFVGEFYGTVYNEDYSINYLNASGEQKTDFGLFGVASNANIFNVKLNEVSFDFTNNSPHSCGSLIGEAKGNVSISNVNVNGEITSARNVGGLVGKATNSSSEKITIADSINEVKIKAFNKGAGFIGYFSGFQAVIKNSINRGEINVLENEFYDAQYGAGIVSMWDNGGVKFDHCTNDGKIKVESTRFVSLYGGILYSLFSGTDSDVLFDTCQIGTNSSLEVSSEGVRLSQKQEMIN